MKLHPQAIEFIRRHSMDDCSNITKEELELSCKKDNSEVKEKMATKNPSDYKIAAQSFERKPTGGIQEIAEKPFTVNHIECFTSKSGESLVIVETDEAFDDIEYKNEHDEKVRGRVSRFFASPIELKKFFSDPNVVKDVNENHNKIKASIEKVAFTPEEIARKASLKGKTHYVFQGTRPEQAKL